jgi:hypothetical protein
MSLTVNQCLDAAHAGEALRVGEATRVVRAGARRGRPDRRGQDPPAGLGELQHLGRRRVLIGLRQEPHVAPVRPGHHLARVRQQAVADVLARVPDARSIMDFVARHAVRAATNALINSARGQLQPLVEPQPSQT